MIPAPDPELADLIADATRAAVTQLFHEYADHHFYYCSLITTGEGHPPRLSAWSSEALSKAARSLGVDLSAAQELRWSYADSPFYCYGEEHFALVDRAFAQRPIPDPGSLSDWQQEIDIRLASMEAAMARLDKEGLFRTGSARLGIVINAEVMPPDATNVERALRLNPREALEEWLAEAAERDGYRGQGW